MRGAAWQRRSRSGQGAAQAAVGWNRAVSNAKPVSNRRPDELVRKDERRRMSVAAGSGNC